MAGPLLALLFVLLGVAVSFNHLLSPNLALAYSLRASTLMSWHGAYWVSSLLASARWVAVRLIEAPGYLAPALDSLGPQ